MADTLTPPAPVTRDQAQRALLRAMYRQLRQADFVRRTVRTLMRGDDLVLPAQQLADLLRAEARAAYFRRLRRAGAGTATSWADLAGLLPDLYRQAQAASVYHRHPDDCPATTAYKVARAEGAHAFVEAARPVMDLLDLTD